jgi:hypothetical protein
MLGRSGTGAAMSIIPLHVQRRFEQRWATQFGSLVVAPLPKNVGMKGSSVNLRRARKKQKKNPPGWGWTSAALAHEGHVVALTASASEF